MRIQLLGDFVVSVDGIAILANEWRLRNSSGLVKLLALAPGHRLHRDQVIDELWPESSFDTALNNLYQTIYKARRVLKRAGKNCLILESGFLSLTVGGGRLITVDVEQFEAAARRAHELKKPAEYQAALLLYPGDLLPDDLYEDWAIARRETLREEHLALLQEFARLYESNLEYDAAVNLYQQLLSLEKSHEEAHSGLMRLYALSGQNQKAVKQFQALCEILREELDAEPSENTIRLYEAIHSGQFSAANGNQKPSGPVVEQKNQPSTERLESPEIPQPMAHRRRHNLPHRLSTLIGREKEIDQVIALVRGTRLLTITGSGGVGKTSLAIQAAVYLVDKYPDGVWLVELAPLSDAGMVPQVCAQYLGVLETPGMPVQTRLAEFLEKKCLLLILDNCEHLVEACARLAEFLLKSCPGLSILATSREPLNLSGEAFFRLPSLSLPSMHRSLTLDQLAGVESVRLFVERARAVLPEFSLTETNASAVAHICQRLDGIPLAIELAAARVRVMSVVQISARLDDVFHLLTSGSRNALPRHQTLRALIGWSHDLLSEKERLLLARLSIFVGGWTLEAAEVVGVDPIGNLLPFEEILDLLGQLSDKSLVQVISSSDEDTHYRMLETVRQYAWGRLEEIDEVEAVRSRHLIYYLRLAEEMEPKLRGREQIRTLDYLESELDNLRVALEYAMRVDVEAGLRLAAALQWFWHIRFFWSEGISWLERGVEIDAFSRRDLPLTGPRGIIRAKALTSLGFHLAQRDQPILPETITYLEEAITLYRMSDLEHRRDLAWALRWLGDTCDTLGDSAQARTLGEESLSLFRETGDLHGIAESLQLLGECEIDLGPQKKFHEEQLMIEQAIGDDEGIATALLHVGNADFMDGEYVKAFAAFESSQKHYRKVGNSLMVAQTGFFLGAASFFSGNLESATVFVEEALADSHEIVDEGMIAACLFWKGLIAFSQGRYEQVADLSDQSGYTLQKTGELKYFTSSLYLRARLTRLRGEIATARQIAGEGLNGGRGLDSDKVLMLVELGHLSLLAGNLEQAGYLWRQALNDRRDIFWLNWELDGFAALAVREGKMERAARIFGTRQWVGFAHTLSPIERTWRGADQIQVKSALGEDRFAQLQAEGKVLTFEQTLALLKSGG